MEQGNWAAEHSDMLRGLVGRGTSFSEIAQAINKEFGTSYSRNATIGRAKRMGLVGSTRPGRAVCQEFGLGRLLELRSSELGRAIFRWREPVLEDVEPVKLRCVEIEPRHLALVELERNDCRYPYGGDSDGEAITFCGHPQRPGSSYCAPHFHLSRNFETSQERPVGAAVPRVVEAA